MAKFYVCEWSKPDISISPEMQIMTTYDFTYHPQLEHAQLLSHMQKPGYIIAKGLVEEEPNVQKISQHLQCLCIWVYDDQELAGKYDFFSERWYFSSRAHNWEEEWKDMLTIPLPIQEA